MTNKEKQWLRSYIKELLECKFSNSHIIRATRKQGFTKSTTMKYIKALAVPPTHVGSNEVAVCRCNRVDYGITNDGRCTNPKCNAKR